MKTVDLDSSPDAVVTQGDTIIYKNITMSYDEYQQVIKEEKEDQEDAELAKKIESGEVVTFNIRLTDKEVISIYKSLETLQNVLIHKDCTRRLTHLHRIIPNVLEKLGFNKKEEIIVIPRV